MSAKTRTQVLEPVNGERGMEAPLAELLRVLQDHAGALMAVGGEFTVRSDRVKIGELPGTDEPCGRCSATGRVDYDQGRGEEDCKSCGGAGYKAGRPEPIGETVGFIVQWRDVTQLRERPLTTQLMDHILGDDELGETPGVGMVEEAERVQRELNEERAAERDDDADVDDDDEDGEE